MRLKRDATDKIILCVCTEKETTGGMRGEVVELAANLQKALLLTTAEAYATALMLLFRKRILLLQTSY